MTYLNISGYKFVSLNKNDLQSLQATIKNNCSSQGFKGTILLGDEGINVFIAGEVERILNFKSWMAEDPRFQGIEYNESYSDFIPYNRMLVKIKKEIIAFGHPEIQPEVHTAPYIKASELKKFLDNKEAINLLDTRNQYETRLGTFENAHALGIDVFRAFPEAVTSLKEIDKSKPLVTFCTGGIRCEKASAFLMKKGFKNIFQLKGGILKYFNECGKDHYKGECFVYDQRVCLDPGLQETQTVQCYNCTHPVTLEEQASDSYEIAKSCPYCVNGKPSKSMAQGA